jgi:hypothetical protein
MLASLVMLAPRAWRSAPWALAIAAVLGGTAASGAAPPSPPSPSSGTTGAMAQIAAYKDRPEAYAALRQLWQKWEEDDPTAVEEGLAAIAADGAIGPAERAYAGLLGAYARRRRGDLAGAQARIAALGFVDRWLVVGPFGNDQKSGLDEARVPEQELAEPIVLDRSFEGKERPVR